MKTLWYLSRTDGRHDQRLVSAFAFGGFKVEKLALAEQSLEALAAKASPTAPDVIVAGPLTDAAAAAVELDAAPVVGMSWAFDLMIEASEPQVAQRLRETLPRLAALHVDSSYVRDLAVELGAVRDRITIAPWGIDLDTFSPGRRDDQLLSRHDVGLQDHVVFTSRSLEPMYDVATVLAGFAQASAVDERLVLAWAGTGSLAEKLAAMTDQLGIAGRVRRLGLVDPRDLPAWLRSSAVYVSAARSDGTSLSMVEALACGTGVVVTDLPSNAEWVRTDQIGLLIQPGDAAGLAAALLRMVDRTSSDDVDARREVALERGDWNRNRAVLLEAVHTAAGG